MFVAISVPSFATNWKYLTTSTDFTEWFIDKDSIKYSMDYKYYPSYSKILPDSISESLYIAVYYN